MTIVKYRNDAKRASNYLKDGCDVWENDDRGGNDGKSNVGHVLRLWAGGKFVRQKRAPAWAAACRCELLVPAAGGSPLWHSVNAGAARMDLKRIGEHDQDDDCGAANRTGYRWYVLRYDVADHVVAEWQVARYGNKHVDASRSTNGSSDDTGGTSRAIVLDFVQDLGFGRSVNLCK